MKLINNLQMRGDLQLHFYFIEEQTHSVEMGTNVLKIAVFIYTNKKSYGIIRVAFVSLSPFWIHCYYEVWKNGISEHFSLIGELF